MMNDRQQVILQAIIERYINTAEPVASRSIAGLKNVDYSPATIRNDIAVLEKKGFVAHPHTSAGSIPTLKGMQCYVRDFVTPQPLTAKEEAQFKSIYHSSGLRGIARQSAALSKSAIILTEAMTEFYFTGFSYLFSQPDFSNAELVRSISRAVDRLETVLPEIAHEFDPHEPTVYIGSNNPLGNDCSALFITSGTDARFIFGILAPVRTNYARHFGLLSSIKQYL